jgi:predicted ATPase
MRRVVITGGPGAGKTTLLSALAQRGFLVVAESAREIIVERVSRGQTPRPDPGAFAREILHRDLQKYKNVEPSSAIAFYDRSAVEALGMVNEVKSVPHKELNAQLNAYKYDKVVFVLPPWREIYRTDSERDHTFEHAQRVYHDIIQWYGRCGYEINEVPRLPVEQRLKNVLETLAHEGDA